MGGDPKDKAVPNAASKKSRFVHYITLSFIPTFFTFPRSITFLVSVLVMITAGTGYAYSLFSGALREIHHYSILETSLIGTAQNQGFYSAAPMAFINDVYGPRMSQTIATFANIIGYGSLFISLKYFPGSLPSPVCMLIFYIIGTALCCQYFAALGTNVRNYSARWRGLVVGIMASCFGISAFIFSAIFKIIFATKAVPFILFMAVAMPSVCILGIVFINVTDNKKDDNKHVNVVEADENSLIDDQADDDLLATQKQIDEAPQDALYFSTNTTHQMHKDDSSDDVFPPMSTFNPEVPVSPFDDDDKHMPVEQIPPHYRLYEDYSPIQMLMCLDFWLSAVMMFTAVGSGLLVMNNLADVISTRSPVHEDPEVTKSITATLVSIISICNCLGRLLAGFFSDLTRFQLSRPFWFMCATGFMGTVQFAFAFSTVQYLYYICAGFGLVYGALFALGPTFISERFGSKYFNTNFALLTVAGPAVGSILIASLVSSWSYNAAAHGKTCVGMICFQRAFFVTTTLCMVGAFSGFLLLVRNRFRYQYIGESRNARKSPIAGAVRSILAKIRGGSAPEEGYADQEQVDS